MSHFNEDPLSSEETAVETLFRAKLHTLLSGSQTEFKMFRMTADAAWNILLENGGVLVEELDMNGWAADYWYAVAIGDKTISVAGSAWYGHIQVRCS